MVGSDAGKRYALIVPEGVAPGHTRLKIRNGDGLVTVPEDARPGDTLEIQQCGLEWKVSNVKPHNIGNKESNTTQVMVPASASMHDLNLVVDVGEAAKVEVRVPESALPGDMLELWRATTSEPEGGAQWRCRLLQEPVGPERSSPSDIENLAQLRSLDVGHMDLSAEQAFQELKDAMSAAGGFVSHKLRRGSVPPLNIPGLIAAEHVDDDEELCRIPARVHISPLTTKEVAPDLWGSIHAVRDLPSPRRDEAAQAVFITHLLKHVMPARTGSSSGKESPAAESQEPHRWLEKVDASVRQVWESYARSLLLENFTTHPYLRVARDPWAWEEEMTPSPLLEHIREMAEDVIATHSTISRACPDPHIGESIDLEVFLHARLCKLSRVFQTGIDSTLVPVADLFNHTPGERMGVVWRWDPEAQAMVLKTCRAHEPGEELLDSYGPRSNPLLFQTYGFTQTPSWEPAWSYCVGATLARPVLEHFLPPSQAKAPLVLDTRRMEDSLVTALNTVTVVGRCPEEFLRMLCARCYTPYMRSSLMQAPIEALSRARALSPASADWWAHLPRGSEQLVELEDVRVKMSEYLCLTAYLEVVGFSAGDPKLDESLCLAAAAPLRKVLRTALSMLKAGKSFKIERSALGSAC